MEYNSTSKTVSGKWVDTDGAPLLYTNWLFDTPDMEWTFKAHEFQFEV